MANEQNLVPQNKRTKKQQREIARMGGIASGKARQEKATMKKTLEMLLNETNKKTGKTYRELATLGLIQGAAKGNGNNYRLILEILGELEQQKEEKQKNGILENLLDALNDAKENK